MVVKRSEWKSILAVTSVCTALLGSVDVAVQANPVLVAQSATARTPQTITGRLDQNSPFLEEHNRYYETHTFDGNAGEALTIELTSDDFDALLVLLNPTGESIATDDNSADGTNARLVITLPKTGTYTIGTTSYQAGAIGDYQLVLQWVTTADQDLVLAAKLNQQALELLRAGRYAEAEPLYQRSLAIREAQLGSEHPDTATSLNNLAELYRSMGRYAEAEPLYQQSLTIFEEQLGSQHPDTATSLNNLAELYRSMGRYAEAETLWQRTLDIQEAQLGSEHPSTATSLNNLAVLYETMGRYAEAETLYQRSLEIREARFGPQHPTTASSLNNLAALYSSIGRYADAESLYQRVLTIFEAQLGPEHPDTAQSLHNLAALYKTMGRYADAEPLLQRSLEIREAQLGPQHPDTASSLNNLALLYESLGRYADAESLYQRSLEIREARLGLQHPDMAQSLNNLALLYESLGRYADAESLYQRALDIVESQLGPQHPSTAKSLNNLAVLYETMGRYTEAEPLHNRALTITESQLGSKHLSTATSLNNLAVLYNSMGRYADAESLHQRALDIRESQLGPEHPSTAHSLNNLALLYKTMGRYAEADPLYQRSLAIFEEQLGPQHPSVATNLNNLAALYWTQGQLQLAFNYLQRGLTVEETVLSRNFVVGSDTDKRNYLTTVSDTTDAAISLYLNDLPTNPDAAQLALTTILQRKGRILDLFTNLRDQLVDDTTAIALLDELTAASTQLANLTDNPSPNLSLDDYTAQLNRLQVQVNTLEGQLSQRSEEFAELTASPSLADIQASLPSGTALVEFIRYRPVNPSVPPDDKIHGSPNYAAFLLFPDGNLQGMDLGPAEAIDAAVGTLADSLASPDTPKFQIKKEAHALEKLVMVPVRQALGDTTTVFLSPDGALNLIPFEALVDENNTYLVERYQFRYLTSGRDLMRIANTTASDNSVVLMGDPTFGRTEETLASTAKGSIRRAINLEENIFPPLAGTRLEVEGIAQHFPEAQVYFSTTATEAQLKTARQPSILHLATHGFFRATEETLNPLLQSGLVLAGVAERQSGPDENGVLTALEVTGLALRGTQLVVLSACETGLGKLSVSEGLYGLRRAMVLAGSQSQVMSLWKVDDTATQELMVAYYEKLRAGTPRDQALTETQREFLLDPEYDHPYYWSAFIGSGDWRPLD